jgi:4'-phosphopantetheinyl transferase
VTELLPAQRTWPLVAAGPAIDRTPLGQVSAVLLDVPRELLHELSQTLSASELERARRFHFESDQARFIAARGALRLLLAAELHVAAELLEFTYGAYGKPDLAPPFDRSGLRFNLAHSENLALIALCRNREIGVDVEAVRALSDELQLVKSCFSAHEQREYQQLDPSRRTAGFFNGWTRKEAFIKALGKGLSQPLQSFDITLAPDEPAKILRYEDRPGADCGWHIDAFTPAPGYAAAVVLQELPFKVI